LFSDSTALTICAGDEIKANQLRELMRHASINTTLGYYVLVDADSLAERLREFSAAPAQVVAGGAGRNME
jgi:hypothetical protein